MASEPTRIVVKIQFLKVKITKCFIYGSVQEAIPLSDEVKASQATKLSAGDHVTTPVKESDNHDRTTAQSTANRSPSTSNVEAQVTVNLSSLFNSTATGPSSSTVLQRGNLESAKINHFDSAKKCHICKKYEADLPNNQSYYLCLQCWSDKILVDGLCSGRIRDGDSVMPRLRELERHYTNLNPQYSQKILFFPDGQLMDWCGFYTNVRPKYQFLTASDMVYTMKDDKLILVHGTPMAKEPEISPEQRREIEEIRLMSNQKIVFLSDGTQVGKLRTILYHCVRRLGYNPVKRLYLRWNNNGAIDKRCDVWLKAFKPLWESGLDLHADI